MRCWRRKQREQIWKARSILIWSRRQKSNASMGFHRKMPATPPNALLATAWHAGMDSGRTNDAGCALRPSRNASCFVHCDGLPQSKNRLLWRDGGCGIVEIDRVAGDGISPRLFRPNPFWPGANSRAV